MTEVLKGVRVVELGTMITAPLAGMMLADLGAEVIKIEHPQGGDPFRSFRGGLYSPHFVAYNRGKRSMSSTCATMRAVRYCASSWRARTSCSRTTAQASWSVSGSAATCSPRRMPG